MEYKFRGKRIDGDGWVYGSLTYIKDQSHKTNRLSREVISTVDVCNISSRGPSEMMLGTPKNDPLRYKRDIIVYPVIPESVGMWTGLKDKKEKDAYERDILQTYYDDGRKGDVGYLECTNIGSLCLVVKGKQCPIPLFFYPSWEIIGNLTDSPGDGCKCGGSDD